MGEKEQGENLWKGPASIRDPKARRSWVSSTAASLLDKDEEASDEPELQCISIESDSSGKSVGKNGNGQFTIRETSSRNYETITPVSSMVRLTEDVTGMLCPPGLEAIDPATMAVQSKSLRRISSETDVLQANLAAGPCGTLTGSAAGLLWNANASSKQEGGPPETAADDSLTGRERMGSVDGAPSTLTRSDTLKKATRHPTQCSDFNLRSIQDVVAADILAILGSSTGVAAEWFTMLGLWINPTPSRESSHNTARRRVYRNRCAVRTAQKHRLKELWYKWHSDGLDDSSSKLGGAFMSSSVPLAASNTNPNMPPFRVWSLTVTKSLDDADMVTPLAVPGNLQSLSREDPGPSHRVSSPADLFYDSDPETFRVSRNSPSASANKDDYIKKKPLRWRRYSSIPEHVDSQGVVSSIVAPIDTTVTVCSKDVGCPLTPRHSQGKGAHSFDVPSFDDTDERFDFHDDGLVKDFVKELTTEKVKLIWHPTPKHTSSNGGSSSESELFSSPVSVKGWFEMGSRLCNRVIQPKFMWQGTHQPDLFNHKRLGISGQTPHSLELLNMIRILKPTTLDRSLYPFAKIDRTFTILCHTNELQVFETVSTEERDWLVHGIKLVVARLASMIIVGDDHMFIEFFSPWSNSPITSDSTGTEEQDEALGDKPLFVSTTDRDRESLWGGVWK